MADSFVRVPSDSTGKRVDATSLDVGADTVYRQRVVIGDNSATAQFAVVTGGALVCTGTFNISAMPTVTVTGGVAVSGTAVVAGNVNISTMPAVVIAAGANNIGTINNISATVNVAGTFTIGTIDAISATVTVAGNVNISTMPSVVLAAGAANIGSINNISRTVTVVGVVSLAAGSANFGTLNDISRTVQVAIGTPFTVNNISATVNVAGNLTSTFPGPTLASGILTASASTVDVSLSAVAGISVQIVGVWTGQLEFEVTTNNTDWLSHDLINITGNTPVNATTGNGAFFGAVGNFRQFRIRASALSVGTVSYAINTTFTTEHMNVRVAGTATVAGNVNISTMPAVSLVDGAKVSISGSVLAAVTGTVGLLDGAKVTISGSITGTVSLAAGSILDSISATVGVKGQVSLAAGTSNIGFINNISATVVVAGVVALTAGTAVIGDLNAISRTVQVAIGTPFTIQGISTTVLVAMSNQTLQGISTTVTVVGNVNISATATVIVQGPVAHSLSITAGVMPLIMGGRAHTSASAAVANLDATYAWLDTNGRQVTVKNHPSLLPSASHGPKCVTVSTSATVALVAAPGAGLCVYVTQIACTNGSATLTRADAYAASQTASCVTQMYMAASGGGFVQNFDPPIKVLSNTALNSRIKPNVSQAIFVVHFYVGPK